jgi:hypothetical protein
MSSRNRFWIEQRGLANHATDFGWSSAGNNPTAFRSSSCTLANHATGFGGAAQATTLTVSVEQRALAPKAKDFGWSSALALHYTAATQGGFSR